MQIRRASPSIGAIPARPAAPRALAALLALGAIAVVPAIAHAQTDKPTDMELDPDAPQPAPEPKAEEAPLPPPAPGEWGVGGKEEEGRFAPPSKKKDEAKEDDGPIDYGPKARVGIDAVIGFGKINVVDAEGNVVTDTTVASFVPFVRYRFGDVWTVGLRVPFATGSSQGPFGTSDAFHSFAMGNVALDLQPTFVLSRHLRLPVSLSFYVPSAQGDPFAEPSNRGAMAQAIVNQAASSSRGFEDAALFASKRIGLAPGLGIAWDSGAAHVNAGTKLEIMAKVGGQDGYAPSPSDPKPAIRGVTTNWVTGASFFYDFLGGMIDPGLRAWVSVFSTPVTMPTVDYSGAQLVLEPEVATRVPIGKSTKLGGALGYIVPVSGELGGVHNKAGMNGLRIRAELLF